jgi:pimeloyl-ACP methyl ester carboxylesterase
MPDPRPDLEHRKPLRLAPRVFMLLALACAGGPAPKEALELAPCRLDGLGVAARCGRLSVFEDRAAARGRRLELRVAVVPALASSPRPDPLFLLVGGPGQAATEAGAAVAAQLRDVLRHRDIVLVDQRGTGQSNPLRCESDQQQPLQELFAPRPAAEKTRACHAALDADTRQYATPTAMADLDDVRAALGYEQIHLWGGSYGTRAALVYLREYPQRVRSLILDGSAPFAIALPQHVARDAQRALDLVFADCQQDADCQRAFPAVREHWQALLDRLGSGGIDVSVAHPRSGAPLGLRIERAGLASAVRNLLYVPELAGLLPLAIERATAGDYGTFVASADAFSRGISVSTGMFLSIVCAEDVPRIDGARAEQLSQGTFLGGDWLSEMRAECDNWPAAQLPPAYFEPVVSDVPALLLSGNLDPVTPPSWGELVASTLSRSRHVIVPGAGHGTTSLGCVPDLIAEFVEHREPAALDPSCVERLVRPAYFTSLQGPTP